MSIFYWGICPHVSYIRGSNHCYSIQNRTTHQKSTNTFPILSLIKTDQTPKFPEKTSRTFITETLTVSRTTQFIRIISIFINTKLNSTNYCANQLELTRTLRDSSRTFIIEFVPSQFKHKVRSRRILRWEEEKLKQFWTSEEGEEDSPIYFRLRRFRMLTRTIKNERRIFLFESPNKSR